MAGCVHVDVWGMCMALDGGCWHTLSRDGCRRLKRGTELEIKTRWQFMNTVFCIVQSQYWGAGPNPKRGFIQGFIDLIELSTNCLGGKNHHLKKAP